MNVLAGPCRYEETIRRSRFLTHAAPVAGEADTLAFFESVHDPQATHNCWAWRIAGRYRFNDDGEPSGSAGRPILAAIEGRELDGVMIVVTRHFGGIKLGVGGLVRAYGGCAAKCLDRGDIRALQPQVLGTAQVDFALVSTIRHLVEALEGKLLSEAYGDAGANLRFELPASRRAEFERTVADQSRGQARVSFRRPAGPA